jgi:hypothetical protein
MVASKKMSIGRQSTENLSEKPEKQLVEIQNPVLPSRTLKQFVALHKQEFAALMLARKPMVENATCWWTQWV